MSARQKDLRTAQLLPHIINIRPHPLALPEAFTRQQLVAAQHCLRSSEIDDNIAEFDPLDQPIDDFADPILEFEKLSLTLRVAHLLNDDLLCCLRSNSPEIDRGQ